MSVIIIVEPSAKGTSARFVSSTVEPPSLVVHDGTVTAVFRPASIAGGLADAAEFAALMVRVAGEWESGCRQALAAAQSGDPFDLEALLAEYDQPQQLGGGEQA